jgi:FkbM family methyltransferase
MLKNLSVEDLESGIEFIDIGASGGFPRSWEAVIPLINYYAFEPNREECERLQQEDNAFNRANYFPFAVAEKTGAATLYKTRDMFCYSLLEPNRPLVDRFEFGPKFEVMGTEQLETVQLGEIEELQSVDMDIIKVDSQGLDQRILASVPRLLERAFYVEIEPGFNQSYVDEDTYASLDQFLRDNGFRLFDLTPHRIGRNNKFATLGAERGELLWAESVWIKDYVGLAQQGKVLDLSRGKALKALLICAVERRLDFGLELATWFCEQGIIDGDELKTLQDEDSWSIGEPEDTEEDAPIGGFLSTVLRMFPWTVREKIYHAAKATLNQTHLFK